MWQTYIYCALLLIILFQCIRKKSNIVGIILFALYATESVFSVIYLKLGIIAKEGDPSNITLFPYLLIIVSLLLFFYPFLKTKQGFSPDSFSISINRKYKLFAVIYNLCGIIVLLISVPTVISMVKTGRWDLTYRESSVVVYSNIVEYFSINFCAATRIVSLLVGFALLRTVEKRKISDFILAIFSIVTATGTAACDAVLSTSRSMFYDIAMITVLVYVYMYKGIEKNRKRFITIVGIISAITVISLFIGMTTSRFATRGVFNNVASYFGQAPIVFNSQVFKNINRFSFGQYALGKLFPNDSLTMSSIGGKWGTAFYMFIGWIYLDWGTIGLLLIALGTFYISSRLIAHQQYYIRDLFLLFSLLQIYFKGVFVIGRSYCNTILSTLIVYFILWVMDRVSFKFGWIGKF